MRFSLLLPLLASAIFVACLLVATPAASASVELASRDQKSEYYTQEVDFLANLKARLTGTTQHNQLIDRISIQLKALGLEVNTDTITFDRENVPQGGPRLTVDGKAVQVASALPYSGTTGATGVTGKLVTTYGPAPLYVLAKGQIAVVPIKNLQLPFSALVKTYDPSQRWPDTANPLVPAEIAGLTLGLAKLAGVKAVIFTWEDISDANAAGQYIPFTAKYQGIPAIFVSGAAAASVLKASKQGKSATLSFDAPLTKDVATRTVWSMIKGSKYPDEVVFVTTHTDGPNTVEENGHIGVLALAKNALAKRPERTHVFAFITGHLRIPAMTEKGQASTRFLDDHPELWAGGAGQKKAVGALVIEHLGAVEYGENLARNEYKPTGKLEPELLYAATPELNEIVKATWVGSDPNFTRVSKPSAFIQFGEGAPMADKEIPNVSLVTTPLYLLAEFKGDENDLVDVPALGRQVDSFERLRLQFDTLPKGKLGSVQKPGLLSYVLDGARLVLIFGASLVNQAFVGRRP